MVFFLDYKYSLSVKRQVNYSLISVALKRQDKIGKGPIE